MSFAHSSPFGKRTSFVIGRVSSDVADRTDTTRICPSSPEWTRTMRAKGHHVGGVASLRMRHKWPIWNSSSLFHHLRRWMSPWRYSLAHRSQKWSRICWMRVANGLGDSLVDPPVTVPGWRSVQNPRGCVPALEQQCRPDHPKVPVTDENLDTLRSVRAECSSPRRSAWRRPTPDAGDV